MEHPWDYKTDDSRQADTIINFIIFCEDEVSEPTYFKYFQTDKIKVNCIGNKKSMTKNIASAVLYCRQYNLFAQREEQEEEYIVDGTQVWCVYDRDKAIQNLELENIQFDISIQAAQNNGIKVAWSNDAFELWVLLHFETVDENDVDRINYYNRLTDIFRNLPNPNLSLQRIMENPNFSYKANLKRQKEFILIVRPEIISKTAEAIQRAEDLENSYQGQNLHPHQKAPMTLVHHLVKELILHGGKIQLPHPII